MNALACFVHRILFLGAAVCIIASANLMLEYNWPVPDSSIDRFPHESSCHHYYLMLSEEDISIEKCPDGQLFDYFKHSCISDREHIHCWSRHFGKIKHGHLHVKHKKHFKCPYPWGKYPNLHDCSKYHLCLNGKSRVKKCAPFELFDKISRKCIASIDAICADKTDVVEHGYVCPKTWGSFTYMKDCSKYYECLQRKPSLRMCQKGYLFDDRLARCAPKEHVYCGLRHNPYENSITIKEEITSVKPTSQETKSIPLETVSTLKEITSLPQKVSTFQKVASLSQETPTFVEIVSTQATENQKDPITEKITSMKPTFQETKSILQETVSTLKEIASLPQKISAVQKLASVPQETRTFDEILSTQALENQPKVTEISSSSVVQKIINNEMKQEISIATENPGVMNSDGQKTSHMTEGFERNEFVEISPTEKEQVSSQIAFITESEDLKKEISTEEKNKDASIKLVTVATQGIEKTSKASTDSSKTGCLPEDTMCTTEKDGTVVKCSSSKDLQPHPKDERLFVDCTGSQIHIYMCPLNLTFRPEEKKCKWQFIV